LPGLAENSSCQIQAGLFCSIFCALLPDGNPCIPFLAVTSTFFVKKFKKLANNLPAISRQSFAGGHSFPKG
jgi:hypothetical protein